MPEDKLTPSIQRTLTTYAKKIIAFDNAHGKWFFSKERGTLADQESPDSPTTKVLEKQMNQAQKQFEDYFKKRVSEEASFNELEYEFLEQALNELIDYSEFSIRESVFGCGPMDNDNKELYLQGKVWEL